jgi:hypothetical protein
MGGTGRFTSAGDGISIGGKIEFFARTQKKFEADQQKRNDAGTFSAIESAARGWLISLVGAASMASQIQLSGDPAPTAQPFLLYLSRFLDIAQTCGLAPQSAKIE